MKKNKPRGNRFVVCIHRGKDEIDLVFGKLYMVAKPHKNDPPFLLRVIDDSGEDYLYPAEWFGAIGLSVAVKRKLAAAI